MNLRIRGQVLQTNRFLPETNRIIFRDNETNREYIFIVSSSVRLPRGEVTMVAEGDISIGETTFLTNCEVNFFITGD